MIKYTKYINFKLTYNSLDKSLARRIFAAIRIYLLSVKSIGRRAVPEGKLESFTKFAGNRHPTFLARSFVTRGHHYHQQPPLIYYGNFSTDTTNIWSDYVSGVLLFMYLRSFTRSRCPTD